MACRICRYYLAERKCLECPLLINCTACPTAPHQLYCSQTCSYKGYERSLVNIYSYTRGVWGRNKGQWQPCAGCQKLAIHKWEGKLYCLVCLRAYTPLTRQLWAALVSPSHSKEVV